MKGRAVESTETEEEIRERLNARMFKTQASHEAARELMFRLAEHVGRDGMCTNRHPGRDERHLELAQETVARIVDLLDDYRQKEGK